MTKKSLIVAGAAALSFAVAAFAHADAPSLPTEYRENTRSRIVYDDLNYLLEKTVLPLGRSEHRAAPKPDAELGTRFIKDNPEPSRLEGNRVMYHFIHTDEQHALVREVRDGLLAVPAKGNFAGLSRNEQLAYWINLHNAIVLAEIAERYPMTDVDRLYGDCAAGSDAFACDRRFDWGGQMISLMDIRDHVFTNWRDPLVMYGFFNGAVGGPNIRTTAYEGNSVWTDLEHNAVDFINSVRGTRMQGSSKLRVSTYYQEAASLFPDFQADLMDHIRTYARGEFASDVMTAAEIRPTIDDWHIADLYNGKGAGPGASHTVSSAGLQKFPRHVVNLLNGVTERNLRRRGDVVIEELQQVDDRPAVDDEIAVKPDN
jgi:hypothetical protein